MKDPKQLAALMFTDIVGSVAMQERLGTAAYTRFVSRHDQIIEECLDEVGGAEILNETGDGFLVRFHNPADAVNTALRLQARLPREVILGEPIRIRIGLHLGVVTQMGEGIRGERRAVGMAINLASRVMDLAEPDQILMTRAVYDDARHYVREHPPVPGADDDGPVPEIGWASHGYYQFAGSEEPQSIFEVGAQGRAPFRAPESGSKVQRCGPEGGPLDERTLTAKATKGETSPPPEAVRGSDVFLSYAPIDDRPMVPGTPGWVSKFKRNLETRMEQLSGDMVKIWRPAKSPGHEEVEEKVYQYLPEAKTLVSVLSPPFAHSPGCRREVRTFCEGTADQPRVADRSRIIKVVKTPVERSEVEDVFGEVYRDLAGFEFFEWDPETGRIREFEESFGEEARQRYYERVYDLAFDICEVLKHYGPEGSAPAKKNVPETARRTVFLAAATSDLQQSFDNLKRELVEQGYRVVPDAPLPMQIEALEEAVKGLLAGCDLVIQMIGQNYGVVPENARHSLAELQNQWAAEHAETSGTERIVWISRDLRVDDERQLDFLQRLRETDAAQPNTEVVVTSLSRFKDLVVQTLAADSERKRRGAAARSRDLPPQVYLICDKDDEETVEPLEDYLFEAGLEVALPEFAALPEKVSEMHREAIRTCDAVLIYYGSTPRAWVDVKLRDLLKAHGYGRETDLEAQAVYVAPPHDRRKLRFKSHTARVLRQPGEQFERFPELDDFIREALQRPTPSPDG